MLISPTLQVVKWNHGVIVIHKDALRWPFQVVILPSFDGPKYAHGGKADEDKGQAKL